jgi:glycerate dehydrogenase
MLRLLRGAHTSAPRLRCVLLNAGRLDYDGRLDFSRLSAVADQVSRHEHTDHADEEAVLARVASHNVVINKEMPLSAKLIRRFPPTVVLIVEAGTGHNNIAGAAARELGIAVTNLPAYSTEAMAHLAITFMLSLSCSLVPQARAMQAGPCSGVFSGRELLPRAVPSHHERCHLGSWPHFELGGKTLGLVGGLGTIGKRVAAIAQALGMRVLASSRSAPLGPRPDGIEVAAMADLLARSDLVSLHAPLCDATVGLIDAEAIGRMKPSAFLINTARGALIDEPSLVEALRAQRIAGAALDVFGEGSAPPPALPADSPLWSLDNVILTPHIGWQRLETRQRIIDMCVENIEAFAKGRPINVVNAIFH